MSELGFFDLKALSKLVGERIDIWEHELEEMRTLRSRLLAQIALTEAPAVDSKPRSAAKAGKAVRRPKIRVVADLASPGGFAAVPDVPKKRNLVADPKDCAAILKHLRLGNATISELQVATGLGRNIVHRCIHHLRETRYVVSEGKGSAMTWKNNDIAAIANGAQAEAAEGE